ncbi:MAG: hypothetical protein HQL95_04635 [Magnetococcales bacterium]|nr:hypothetical protein [Magnetococcales bacterium]
MRCPTNTMPITLVAGDHGTPLLFTIRDSSRAAPGRVLDPRNPDTWMPYDLTRVAAIHVPIRPVDRSQPPRTLTAVKLSPFGLGFFQMVWEQDLFATPGRYEGEVRLEYADGAVETVYLRLLFVVRESLQ